MVELQLKASNAANMKFAQSAERTGFLSDLPRLVLLELNGATPEAVVMLEDKILQVHVSIVQTY